MLSVAALGIGFAVLVAGIVVSGFLRTGNLPGELQRNAWFSLATAVLEHARVPLWAATLVSWLLVVRVAPRLDASWRTLALGIAGSRRSNALVNP